MEKDGTWNWPGHDFRNYLLQTSHFMDEEWRPREGKCLSPGHTAINGQSQRLNSSPGPAHHRSDELGLGERCGCLGRGQNWLLMLAGKIHCQGFRTAGGKWASGGIAAAEEKVRSSWRKGVSPSRAPGHTDPVAGVVLGIAGTLKSRWAFGLEDTETILKGQTPIVCGPWCSWL